MRTCFAFSRLSALALAAWLPLSAAAQSAPYRNYDWPGPWHMMAWGGWGFGWIFPLLMIVLMIALCVFIMRGMAFGHGHGRAGRDTTASALEILNERFARGEISKEELEERRSIVTRRA